MFSDNLMLADSQYGVSSASQVEELSKALLAPGSSNDLYTTAGGSLTMQSLEGMLADLTLNSTDFTFWSDVNKIKAFSTVEEFDQQIGLGINDGGFVGQLENPEFRDPDFQKQVAIVRYMSEGWTVGDVQEATKTIIDVRTRMQRSAMNRLLRNANRAFYSGNTSWISESFNGLAQTIAASSTDQIRDMRGGNLSMATFNLVGQLITEGNGHVENAKIYVSPAGVQNLGEIIETGASSTGDRKIVEMGSKGITIGGKITGIMTNYGLMIPRMDKILGLEYESKMVPQYYNNTTSTWIEGATSDKAPSMPAIALTVNAGPVAGSQFSAGVVRPSGATYRYRVVARNKYGRSIACATVTAGGVVGAGGSISIAITPNPADSGSKLPSCFEIYSEQTASSGTFRYMDTIAAAANPLNVVTYTDLNTYIPGTARIYVIDQTSAGEDRVMAFSQLLPVHNTDLAKVGRYSQGLINLYGTPKYYKPNVLCEIRNIGIDQSTPNRFNMV